MTDSAANVAHTSAGSAVRPQNEVWTSIRSHPRIQQLEDAETEAGATGGGA